MNRPNPVPVFCALDTTDLAAAAALARTVAALGFGLKLGKEFFAAHGPEGVRRVVPDGTPLFLDLKFHDIPNTVAGAVRAAAAALRPRYLTVHALGGAGMLAAAAASAAEFGASRPRILAVTVLTSLDEADLDALGIAGPLPAVVERLSRLAAGAGADGVICAAPEITALRARMGPKFELVVPGIRPPTSAADDQKRVMTPVEALALGADWLVIGRPITAAPDPAAAAAAIAAAIAGAAAGAAGTAAARPERAR